MVRVWPKGFSAMAWTIPQHSRRQVDLAGQTLINGASTPGYEESLTVINNWRSSHALPLQYLKVALVMRARRVDRTATIAQRLKRLVSIYAKLTRFERMRLSQMQDLGGCRAVVTTVDMVEKLVASFERSIAKRPNEGPLLVRKDDYIKCPKEDGYRGVHLIYKYRSKVESRKSFNGLLIEIQLRSRLQHAWATAVETVDVFTEQALKSNIGKASWKRFFALMGSAIAIREKQPLVQGTPINVSDLRQELLPLTHELKIESVLEGYSFVMTTILGRRKDAYMFLLVLDVIERTVEVSTFQSNELEKATARYLLKEKEIANRPSVQAVLVQVSSIQALRTAYPNFYVDTTLFRKAIQQALSE